MSTATALAVPFEDYFLKGSPLTSVDVDGRLPKPTLATQSRVLVGLDVFLIDHMILLTLHCKLPLARV
jgi:hypothetical protein